MVTMTTPPGSSSLSRAVQAGLIENEKGAFEACFAGGLDLSDFAGSNNDNSSSKTSASAALLLIKAQEAAVRQRQEQEEAHMQELVQQRVRMLKESSGADDKDALRAAPPTASQRPTDLMNDTSLFGTLVSMHGGDEVNPSRSSRAKQRKDKRLLVVKKATIKASSETSRQASTSKGRLAKKSKRSKY
jgi:hypothetical protein